MPKRASIPAAVLLSLGTGGAMAAEPNREALEKAVERVAMEIAGLKREFPHFAEYLPESARFGLFIDYSHGVRYVPNPEAAADAGAPGVKQHLVPDSIPQYSRADGIHVRIEFVDSETLANRARAAGPGPDFGDWSAEMEISGASTHAMTRIRKAVRRILDAEKKRLDKEFGGE